MVYTPVPPVCSDGKLGALLVGHLCNSALAAAVIAIIESAGGLVTYARLLEESLKHNASASRELTFDQALALPTGLGATYTEDFARAFAGGTDDTGWKKSKRIVALIVAVREPLPVNLVVPRSWSALGRTPRCCSRSKRIA